MPKIFGSHYGITKNTNNSKKNFNNKNPDKYINHHLEPQRINILMKIHKTTNPIRPLINFKKAPHTE